MAEGYINQTWNDSGDGYCKMPDGTLIQWGHEDISNLAPNTDKTIEVRYPVSFASGTIGRLFCNVIYWSIPSLFSSIVCAEFQTYGVIRTRHTDASSQSYGLSWMAIGRWK